MSSKDATDEGAIGRSPVEVLDEQWAQLRAVGAERAKNEPVESAGQGRLDRRVGRTDLALVGVQQRFEQPGVDLHVARSRGRRQPLERGQGAGAVSAAAQQGRLPQDARGASIP